MEIRKAVITAAGIGTRLLTVTKETPKEMLPLYSKNANGELCLKPVLQLIFEQLFNNGFREFCFVVGRGKRSIEDHFTPDYNFVDLLKKRGKDFYAQDLKNFYDKIEKSTIFWVNQYEPKGFGHAVLSTKSFVDNEMFLVHAGDTLILYRNHSFLKRLISNHLSSESAATLLLKEVYDPKRLYGVAEVEGDETRIKVKRVIEKPEKPPTNLALMPIYVFDPVIFRALEITPIGIGGEIQLTDGIQKLIDWGLKVEAVKLKEDELRLDVGSPETYMEAIDISFKCAKTSLSESDATK
jgi:UTP--glucose-1-phosphate uridylyltransferase